MPRPNSKRTVRRRVSPKPSRKSATKAPYQRLKDNLGINGGETHKQGITHEQVGGEKKREKKNKGWAESSEMGGKAGGDTREAAVTFFSFAVWRWEWPGAFGMMEEATALAARTQALPRLWRWGRQGANRRPRS